MLCCQLFRYYWHYQHYLFVTTRKFPCRFHRQHSTCHFEDKHRLSYSIWPRVYWSRVIVVFHSYCTGIMITISADRAECDLVNTKIRYYQTRIKMFRSSGTWRCVSTQSSANISWWLICARNIRNMASFFRGKKASHTPLRKKNSKYSPHFNVRTGPLRYKLEPVWPSLCSWWVRQSGGWRPTLNGVLEIVLSA
jgi:hypothetical protein